ncbi:transposase [Bacillus paranthracis]|uniref:RNA-guided endonuclease InsQ/TnpB family protein n=1 Tax=Bacillus paranthracis TaxID=2026186 RepID=UPI000200EB5F|nr:RNA-guided endonuclease TnpB family protein [Bacillus paranthracis]ADY22447.1 transposase, IS605 family protein [Bacillus thuringiensis serovar finitimus YBT-020]MRC72202.1 IS200/IS605 family element transposase accessory protein TnpB [Bacillus thuringiensis]OTX69221.1 transposase [Bacillus thuringiensis serovar finitimus]MCR6797367.1 transposase [Bacillus paranthracis]MEC3355859.1 transposase [Bacillus paranthracis]
MKRAYLIEIKPTTEQVSKIRQTIGVCRYVYNLYISKNKEAYESDGKFLSGYDFSKWLNNIHAKECDQWIKEVSSKAVKQAIMNGDKAFKRFFKGLSKFPRYKKKKKQDVKCYFPKNNKTDWTVERHRVKIPTIGWTRLKEYGYIPKNATVKSGTVYQRAGRYYISILCEVKEVKPNSILNAVGIGIDFGIKDFAVRSDGKTHKNINKTVQVKKIEKRLKREQRSLSRKFENIRKRGEQSVTNKRANIDKNILRVQQLHARLANIRLAYVKSIVNDVVKTKPMFITVEDLNVKGMMKNKHLSKAVAQQCFYAFKTWLSTKCREYGIELRQVDRFYPSSKICSCCGQKKSDLKLSDRVYTCDCGNVMDRDLNASINLLQAKKYTILT